MSQMLALKLERVVISSEDAAQNAFIAPSCRNPKVEVTHTLLQALVSLREAFANRCCISGTT
jgi:hypothetical protein